MLPRKDRTGAVEVARKRMGRLEGTLEKAKDIT